jgi:hypothetical protein
MHEYMRILLGARQILHISRIKAKAIELLRTLRTNGQDLGPTSEWYLAGMKTRAARKWEMEEDADCSTCRNYSVREDCAVTVGG